MVLQYGDNMHLMSRQRLQTWRRSFAYHLFNNAVSITNIFTTNIRKTYGW